MAQQARSRARTRKGARRTGAAVVAVANQKGGVAKTTSVASLGAAFAELGKRVLLVDLDAQACLTFSLGVDPDGVETSINEVLLGKADATEALIACEDGVDLLPSVIELAGAEAQLLPRPGREYVLRSALEPLLDDYDVVLLDCSPSLGVLTLNALTAARGLVIPMPCEMLSHRGVGQLLDTVADVQRILNPDLEVLGHPADDVRRAQQPRAGGARRRGGALPAARALAADPQDRAVRRGPRRRPLHPHDLAQLQGRPGLPRRRRRAPRAPLSRR